MKLTDRSFRAEKDGSFTAIIRQQKTGKEVNIPIVGKRAVEVVKTGLFRAVSHQKYNTYIKELAQRTGIDQIIKSNKGAYAFLYIFLYSSSLSISSIRNRTCCPLVIGSSFFCFSQR